MLYATDEINVDDDFNKAMVGVASVWRVLHLLFFTSTSHPTFPGMRETRTHFPFTSTFNSILNFRNKLQQASSGSRSNSQGFSLHLGDHWLSVWNSGSQRWHQHGYTRNVVLPSIQGPNSRPSRNSRRWSSPRWYGRRSRMRQKYARSSHRPSVVSTHSSVNPLTFYCCQLDVSTVPV